MYISLRRFNAFCLHLLQIWRTLLKTPFILIFQKNLCVNFSSLYKHWVGLLWPTDISAESLLEKKNRIQESYIEITIKYIHTIYTYTHTYIYIWYPFSQLLMNVHGKILDDHFKYIWNDHPVFYHGHFHRSVLYFHWKEIS